MTQTIINNMATRKRHKADVGEDLYAIATKVQFILQEAKRAGDKASEEKTGYYCDYLKQYHEIRLLQTIQILQKVADQFYDKHDIRSGNSVDSTIIHLSNRDHIRVSQANGAFHVNSLVLNAEASCLETSSLLPQFGSITEKTNFLRCIHPVISDKAMEPPEITLLESVYLNSQGLISQEF
jgi:hypothetical protein